MPKMKKISLNFLIILLFNLLILTGCSGPYQLEREYWLVNRKYSRFLKNIDKAKESDYRKLIINLKKIIIDFPPSPQSARAQLNIGNLYGMQSKRDKAIEEYEKVLENYPAALNESAKALFSIGLIYQQENNWLKAEEYFKKTLKDYPETETGLLTPLYFARYYKSKDQTDKAKTAYSEAIKGYKGTISKNQDNVLGLLALDYIVNCFGDEAKWQKLLVFLEETSNKYPEGPLALKSLFVMGRVNEVNLKNEKETERIYREIIERFPESPIALSLKKYLASKEE